MCHVGKFVDNGYQHLAPSFNREVSIPHQQWNLVIHCCTLKMNHIGRVSGNTIRKRVTQTTTIKGRHKKENVHSGQES